MGGWGVRTASGKSRVDLHVSCVLLQTSAEYRCEASNWAGRRNATVSVDVLDTNVTAYCRPDGEWPLTGAGKSASAECPKNRSTSYASRACVLTASNVTEWQTADYSRCTPEDLNRITVTVSIPSAHRGYRDLGRVLPVFGFGLCCVVSGRALALGATNERIRFRRYGRRPVIADEADHPLRSP